MTVPMKLGSDEIIMPLLLVKSVLAILAVVLFLYYRFYWERAKKHLAVHFFFAKWRAVKHAFILGIAAIGFAAGFTLELVGQQLGLSPNEARFASSICEVGSLFSILYVFFTLSLEDVPHFQHIAESARAHRHSNGAKTAVPPAIAPKAAAKMRKKAKKASGKKRRKNR